MWGTSSQEQPPRCPLSSGEAGLRGSHLSGEASGCTPRLALKINALHLRPHSTFPPEADRKTMVAFSFFFTWLQKASLFYCCPLSRPAMTLMTSDTGSPSSLDRLRKAGMELTQSLVLCLQHCLTWQLPTGMPATGLWTNSRSVMGRQHSPKAVLGIFLIDDAEPGSLLPSPPLVD